MRAIRLNAPKQLERIDAEEPSRPAAGEAVVRVHNVGICGTDVSGYLGKMPFFKYPRIPGHELGVEVIDVGEGVTHMKPGDHCAVEPYMHCGACRACEKGATNCCENLRVIGVMVDGGLRERFAIRADKLHPTRTLTFDQLALVETLAIGCHAVDRARPGPADNVLVIGAGPIGLATLEFVRLTGARTLAVDLSERRLDFCRSAMGVETLVGGDDVEQRLRETCGGNLPDVVFDATGSAASMSRAFGLVAPVGRLVYVGITTDEVQFTHPVFHRPEGTLLCTRNAMPSDFTRIIRLIEDGKIDTGPWITHRSPLERLVEDFPSYADPQTGVVKAMVDMAP